MEIYKEFVCLASSVKNLGHCIAGKEIEDGHVGKWIRPICDSDCHELTESERRYQHGDTPELLDIIGVHFKEHVAHPVHEENYPIDDAYYWTKKKKYSQNLAKIIDTPDSLWENECSSEKGENDRVPVDNITASNQSLFFIFPSGASVIVSTEGVEFNNEKKRVQIQFDYNDTPYILLVTDPDIESDYLEKGNGSYPLSEKTYITVSFGEEWQGYYYKLAAGIIEAK
ncbi:hypothetical protein MNBD_GAMMA16-1877 [hydrothermal vent metagenome]|uniref:Dual OB-containing domain-containing protein n=1 Tax=hydrothermal vent metagenome TaxID=652676 RepID=A0A3B0ZQT4_9ZZZZ